jgi:hypothetical protein
MFIPLFERLIWHKKQLFATHQDANGMTTYASFSPHPLPSSNFSLRKVAHRVNLVCATESAQGLRARAEIHTMPKRFIKSYTPFSL